MTVRDHWEILKGKKADIKEENKVELENGKGVNGNGEGAGNCEQCSHNMFKALYVHV